MQNARLVNEYLKLLIAGNKLPRMAYISS